MRNNKIEGYLNLKKYSESPNKNKRKKASNISLKFCFVDKEGENEDTCSNCFLCGWLYPKEMDVKDKNEHVNYCADGEGDKHKKNYGSSQRLIKIAINSQEAENLAGNNHQSKNYNGENGKEKGNNFCSICAKRIYLRNGRTIDDHVLECYKEREQEIFTNKTQKK